LQYLTWGGVIKRKSFIFAKNINLMEFAIEYKNVAPLLPAMRRARWLFLMAWTISALMPLAHLINFYYGGKTSDLTYFTVISWIVPLVGIMIIAGYLQLCFVGNKAFRAAGIILVLGDIVSWLSNSVFGPVLPLEMKFIISFFFGLGIAILWLASEPSEKKILRSIVALNLAFVGYNLMSGNIFEFENYSNPFTTFMHKASENGVTYSELHIAHVILSGTYAVLWWLFCSHSIQRKEVGGNVIIRGILSRTFIAYMLCWVLIYISLSLFSNMILS